MSSVRIGSVMLRNKQSMVSATETIRGMFLITGRVDQRLRLRFGPVWMSLMLVSQEKGAWRVS